MIGQRAGPFYGSTTEGEALHRATLRGKPALLIFMNLDKGVCAETAPQLEAFAQHWQPRGLQVVGIVIHGEQVKEFKQQYNLSFPLIKEKGWAYVVRDYQIGGSLVTVVIDARGIIRQHRWRFYPAELTEVVTQLLNQ